MFNYMEAFGEYRYIINEGKMFILHEEALEEYQRVKGKEKNYDPHNYSIAFITAYRRKAYAYLIGEQFIFPLGLKRDWVSLKETIDEGMRLYQEMLDKLGETKQ